MVDPIFRMLPSRPSPSLWRCMCDGCGAPVQRNDLQCSYCLRSTGNNVILHERIDITTLGDAEPRFLDIRPTRQPPPENDGWA